jgi:hypothetical protein
VEVQEKTKRPWFNRLAIQYLLVLFCSLVLYTATCAPTVLWQDSGLFVYRIWHNDLQGNLGIALAHPLYIMFGIAVRLVPVGELAWRVNMLSAIFGAIAVANLFLLLRLWLGRVWPAIIGSVTLAVSWTFWQNAVIAETYALYAAQLFTELLVLFQYVRTKRTRYLYLLGLLNGLAVSNHLWGLFPLACYGLYLLVLVSRRELSLKVLALFIILWVIGAVPYEYLVLKNLIVTGDVKGTIESSLFGSIWQGAVLNTSLSAKLFFENLVFIALNFPTPNFLLLFVGLVVLYKKSPSIAFANIILALTVLYFVFAFRYTVPDRHAFFLPFYCLGAVFIALGADRLLAKYSGWKSGILLMLLALLPVGSYFVTPEIARKYYKPLAERRQRPYRDEYTYWLVPWKTGYNGAERFATEALSGVEYGAVVYAYTTDVHAMLYVQEVRGLRPDVKIVSDHDHSENAPTFDATSISKIMAERPLYVTSNRKGYRPRFLDEKYEFIKQGLLYRVVELKNHVRQLEQDTKSF